MDLWQVAQSHIDIYSPPSSPELPISLLELPHSSRNITIDAHSFKLSTKSLAESVSDWNLPSLANTTYHSDYHPLFEIEAFINRLAALNPNTTQLHRLGHSGQGREMVSLTISKGHGVTRTEKKERGINKKQLKLYAKPAFVIIGAQHAREVLPNPHVRVLLFIWSVISGSPRPRLSIWPMPSHLTPLNLILYPHCWTSSYVLITMQIHPLLHIPIGLPHHSVAKPRWIRLHVGE